MRIAGKTTLAVVGVVALWIGINTILGIYPDRPETLKPRMQLAPYHEDMSLREVFGTFPEYGAGEAQLRLLKENNLAWAARWDMLDRAEKSITVSYFILKQDVFGVSMLGHLLKKAREGVKIRILLDAFGSRLSWHPKGNDYLDALVNTGNVEVRMYRPLPDRIIKGLLDISLAVAVASDHDKILVVDGEHAITGGRNIATSYFTHPDDAEKSVKIDMDVEVADRGAAKALTGAFDRQYYSDGAESVTRERINLKSQEQELGWAYHAMDAWLRGEAIADKLAEQMEEQGLNWAKDLVEMRHLKGMLTKPQVPYMTAEIHVLDSVARFLETNDTISRAATRLTETARKEVFVQNPYVMLSEDAVDVLARTSNRGVVITLFTNSPRSGVSAAAQSIFLEQWPQLLAQVPTMRLYVNGNEHMVHAKLASFDNTVSLVGTYNLSPFSMATNSEVVLAVWSEEFAGKLTGEARTVISKGPPRVYRYEIARSDDGSPRYDDEGNLVVAFGPEDHIDMDNLKRVTLIRSTLQAADMLPGVSPFF